MCIALRLDVHCHWRGSGCLIHTAHFGSTQTRNSRSMQIPCSWRWQSNIPGREGARYRISTTNDSFTAWQYWEADSKSRTWETSSVWLPRRTFLATTRRQLQRSWILAIACLLLIWVLPFNLFSKLLASVNFTTYECSSSVRISSKHPTSVHSISASASTSVQLSTC